jgi:hypothetical protein
LATNGGPVLQEAAAKPPASLLRHHRQALLGAADGRHQAAQSTPITMTGLGSQPRTW